MKKIFEEARGQKTAVSILSSQVVSGNLSHAYIFIGKNGTGKEFIAKHFARLILCENGLEDDCTNCQKFEKGVHPDFIKIEGDEGIKIEEIRGLIERINLSPNLSKRKVVLITKAENLGNEAANALLKTFEEPPRDTVIILTAVSEKSVPQTIISRGQKIKFNELSEPELKSILGKEYSDEQIVEVLPYAKGSVGDAFKMLKDSDFLTEKKNLRADALLLFHADSVLDRFKMIESYEKNKKLRSLFDAFSQIIFDALSGSLNKNDSQQLEKHSRGALRSTAKKVLKIYSNLDYNVNLRTSLEEIILQDLTND